MQTAPVNPSSNGALAWSISPVSHTLILTPGQPTGEVPITITDDDVALEVLEQVVLTFSPQRHSCHRVAGGAISSALISVVDDDSELRHNYTTIIQQTYQDS